MNSQESNTPTTTTYTSMLKNAKKAKSEKKDTFEYFVKAAVGSEAFKMIGNRVIECRENVAGMTLIFICMALMKAEADENVKVKRDDMILMLKAHLNGLLKMRTSTNVPLAVIPESEGVMFPGEGMFLRFLNSLIILESLLLSKLKKSADQMKETWQLYSSLDLVVYLQLPALLDGILSDAELAAYAAAIAPKIDGEPKYKKERGNGSDLVRAMIQETENDRSNRTAIILFGIVLFILYTVLIIKLSK